MEEILQPIYRIEDYWYAIVNGMPCPHTPIYRIEQYLAYLCGADVEVPQPIYRTEQYLAYKCGLDVELPTPIYRQEMFLAKWCGMDIELPEPIYRIEWFLEQLSKGYLITKTGNPISVSDALALPAESLVVNINAVQSGSGDPSPDNVRPISGHSEVSAYHGKVSILDGVTMDTGYFNDSGTPRASANTMRTEDYIPVTAGEKVALRFATTNTGNRLRVHEYDSSKTWLRQSYSYVISDMDMRTDVLTISNDASFIRFSLPNYSSLDAFNDVDTYTIQFGQTVYGGSLDVTTGVLTKVPYYDPYNGELLVGPWVSSMDKYVSGNTPTTGAQVVDLGGTGTEVQLTATEVQMLLGNNTLWNDINGDMTLEYLADGPADDADALMILLGNRYVNNGEPDEATDREALEILLGGNTR